MNVSIMSACVGGSILVSTACACEAQAQQPVAGGYSEAAVTDKVVIAAADFAITAQAKEMRGKDGAQPAGLKLVEILSAHQQVVAGLNIRLRLKVELDGVEKDAKAIVWWQAWRKPDPHRLTSWKWMSR
ncbi:MAG: hypothetical protein WCL44_06985 [bacterium]